ncbi:MAG: hypothetical protein ACI808_002663 [Paraglaciecola sp.]|jgi:hypothetical protein
MLFVYFLIVSIAILLAFSMSKDTGKNTIYARKMTNAMVNHRVTHQIDPSSVVEIS